jgi:FAD/FMN-containing dehydrogenase
MGLTRRDALRLAGVLGAGSVLAACTGPHPSAGPAPVVTTTPPRVTPSTPAVPNWSALAGQLQGRLLRQGDSGYAPSARLYNSRFDPSVHPTAIVAAISSADVATAVRFVADTRLPFAIRSGGHSYPGWSTSSGVVIDVSGLRSVTVDTANQLARVGAGAPLVSIYTALAAKGVGIPAGSCPTVGIGGHAQGGGVGVLTRAWGLTCDNVRSVEIVTADGRIREVDQGHDPELFWAVCGGGGGSFGAVTAFTLAVRPVTSVSTFYLDWPESAAADLLDAWQHWIRTADHRLTSTCKLLTDVGGGQITPMIAGASTATAAQLNSHLAPLLAQLPGPSTVSIHDHTYADAMLIEAGCSGQSTSDCLANSLSADARQPFAATSSIVDNLLPSAGIDAAVARAHAAYNVPGLAGAGISFDSFGGAVADLAPDANAFGHRTAIANIQYTATWTNPAANPAPYDAFVRANRAAMAPWLGNAAYVNYADAAITDYGTAYYGANYPRLQQAKSAYDPHGLFTFPQAVQRAV